MTKKKRIAVGTFLFILAMGSWSFAKVPTEEEDLKMLMEASQQQQKQMQEMIKKSQKLIEDMKNNPEKYRNPQSQATSKSSTKNSDGIPVQNLSGKKANNISPVTSGARQPQITQEQLDQLLKSLDQTRKAIDRRNKAMEKLGK